MGKKRAQVRQVKKTMRQVRPKPSAGASGGTQQRKQRERYVEAGGFLQGYSPETVIRLGYYSGAAVVVSLLIMVERGGEGRLQTLRRRLRALNDRFRTQLDVRLSRADLLTDEHDRLNPTKPAWRTVNASQFVDAFEA